MTTAWLVRAVSVAAFAVLMSWEWSRWPNGTPLLGPLGIVWYNGWGADNLALLVLSFLALAAYLGKPNIVTGVISGLGVVSF